MKKSVKGLFHKVQHLLLMVSATLPAAVWLVLQLCPDRFSCLPVFPAACVLLGFFGLLLPGTWRIPLGVGGTAALAALALWLLPVGQNFALLLLPAGYGVLLFLMLPVSGWPQHREPAPQWAAVGIGAHLLLQLMAGAAQRSGSALYQPAEPLRIGSFLLFLLLTLLSFNRANLGKAAQNRVQIPRQMRRRNAALTISLMALALLVAALPAIGKALSKLWDMLWKAIASAAAFLASLLSAGDGGSGGDGGVLNAALPVGETAEPGLFQLILEKVLGIIAIVALAVLLGWIGWRLWKVLRRLFGLLRQKLSSYGNAAAKDYEDEVTDTRDDGEYRSTGLMRRLRTRLTRADESRMTPAQRVRYRYLRLRDRHSDWLPAHTARETLPPEAACLYERARYGGQSLSDAEAEQFREKTRRL